MVADIFRDASVGQFVNFVSKGKYLPYADEKSDFVVHPALLLPCTTGKRPILPSGLVSDVNTLCGDLEKRQSPSGAVTPRPELQREDTIVIDDIKDQKFDDSDMIKLSDPYLVDWCHDDPDNPRSVSFGSLRCLLISVAGIGVQPSVHSLPSVYHFSHSRCTSAPQSTHLRSQGLWRSSTSRSLMRCLV